MTRHALHTMAQVTLALLPALAVGSSALGQTNAPAAPPQWLRIFFSEAPALLVQINGGPRYQHIAGTNLDRITNTKALILRNADGVHYLKVRDGWMEAYELLGTWTLSGWSPMETQSIAADGASLTALAENLEEANTVDDNPPTVFVSIAAAALIVTNGAPRYENVAGTSLRFLANTTSKVYREPTDDQLYAEVGNSWYRSWTIDGSWQLIAVARLPRDIARQIQR